MLTDIDFEEVPSLCCCLLSSFMLDQDYAPMGTPFASSLASVSAHSLDTAALDPSRGRRQRAAGMADPGESAVGGHGLKAVVTGADEDRATAAVTGSNAAHARGDAGVRRLYLSFLGCVLSETSRGKRTAPSMAQVCIYTPPPLLTQAVQDGNPSSVVEWDGTQIPVLQAVLGHRQTIAHHKLFFLLKSGHSVSAEEDVILGQGLCDAGVLLSL